MAGIENIKTRKIDVNITWLFNTTLSFSNKPKAAKKGLGFLFLIAIDETKLN